MADWVHCNSCFQQPGSGGRQFSLTNCGHIYCSDCLRKCTKDSCKMCGNQCTVIPLSARMKPEVEVFFIEPSDILKKSLKQVIEVMDFQKNHRKRLSSHRFQKDRNKADFVSKQNEDLQRLERESQRLREENAKLRSMLAGAGRSPGPGGAATHNRPPTPGRTLHSSSPTSHYRGKSPSPNKSNRSTSPYAASSKSPYAVNMHHDLSRLQLHQNKTPQGPARVSVRTPPVDGKIGTVGTPTTVHGPVSRTSSVASMSSLLGRKTPNGIMDYHRNSTSPRVHSPSSATNRSSYQTPRRPVQTLSPSYSLGATQHSRSDTPQSQVMYIPKRPLSCGATSHYVHGQP